MSLKRFWIDACVSLSYQKADFYSGARKIIRGVKLTYIPDKNFDDLKITDCGFTKSKMSMLHRNYYLEESISAAKILWDERKEKDKYGSVGFSCYAHYMKGDVKGATKRGSKMGPCIQAVTLTLLKKSTAIDVFYRTTELFKKFPADLVFLRDELLPNFNLDGYPIGEINFHFANVTCHPMYAVTFLPHIADPPNFLDRLKKRDKFFFDWLVKWTARYICDEHSRGIQKFSQALRVQKDAKERIDKKMLKELQKYFRKNHPGHRADYEEDEE